VNEAAPPPAPSRPPAPTPPSIESSVREHLDVVHELREFRVQLTTLVATVTRLIGSRTEDRLTIGGLEKRIVTLEKKVDAIIENQLALMKHLGVQSA
jgi:hypothetical protein